MDKLQEEAVRRVRQMQSSGAVETNNSKSINPPKPMQREAKSDNPGAAEKSPEHMPEVPFTELFKDKEKLLVLLLIMILSQDGTNTELVLALLYIII